MNTTYKRNLIIGFGISLLILLVTSTASYISIRNLLDSADWVNHTNEVILELNSVNIGMKDAETNQRGYLLTEDERFLEPFQNGQRRATAALRNVETLTLDNPQQRGSLNELRKLLNQRITRLQDVVDIKRKQGTIQVEKLKEGRLYMDSITDVISMMQKREQDLLVQRTARLNSFSMYTPVLIIAASVIALVITILFYIRINNDFNERSRLQAALEKKDADISNRIGIIRDISDKVSQGNYAIRLHEQQRDALGDVAVSLNKMASSLEQSFQLLSDKEWLQTGIAKLNDAMIGEKALTILCQDIIEFIATYTHSHAGAFYLLDRDDLQVAAGFAYVPDKQREKFKLGEGLIGQAVAGGKIMELKNIPSESIYIRFTTGEATPNHVLAIPIFDGYTIKGGLELASLRTFSEREVEFLNSCSHNIGIAISTAQNRKKLQELLEETQSQAEELQAQHNELENMNSELEVQAEKLQASEEELKVQQEELRQANQELEERSSLLEDRNQLISERNAEIQAKAEALAQSAKYKSEFLANMSHELRTPLNSILLLSRLLSENIEKNLTGDQIEYARVIQSSGNGLLALIDEILDLSKIESGKMNLEYSFVSVYEIVNDMKALFSPLAKEKGINFKTDIAADVPERIETDKLRLEQIIKNLLSNALKFTAKGYVSLAIAPAPDDQFQLRIAVKDSGIGIASEKQELIFEAFQQADGSTRRKYGGTGLGLSISRELAKLLGGEISLVSEIDKGSEFIILIPTSRTGQRSKPVRSVATRAEQVEKNDATIKPSKTFISSVVPESIPDDRNDIRDDDKIILIIEDDVNFAKALLDFTRKQGYKGLVAVRGDEGITLAKTYSPVGILLDIQLPVKSGWDVMEELKGDPATRHIPVHIMSSHEVKYESLTKGAIDFINKPVAFEKMADIFHKIEHVLNHHPKKVLIVEENAKHAKALAYFLETFDVSPEIKNGVHDAIRSLKQQDVNCVILDMGIPDQRSYDTLEEVKKTPGLENLPIIIFTGKSLSRGEELRIKQYADSIVLKTAHSYKRILDEVSLFLHLMEKTDADGSPKTKYHKLGALDEVLKDKTVLIVDDDMRNIFSLTKTMENYKMNVITAIDGKDALKQLRANPSVDIVLMDMMMPEMDGYESTAAIRKDPTLKDIPVIAVTAKAMMGDRAKCINAGASDYITKPVDIDQLLSLLRVWLYEGGSRTKEA